MNRTPANAGWGGISGLTIVTMAFLCAQAAGEQADGPFDNLRWTPLQASWQYSRDGGKTFSDAPLPGPPLGRDPRRYKDLYPYVWKGTFTVDDPAAVGGIFLRLVEKPAGETGPRAAICNGDLWAASGGWWKDLGYCPTLLDAKLRVNGKEVQIAHGPVLQFWVPLSGLQAGRNTVELSGSVYTYWRGSPAEALDARLVAARPQPAEIRDGPILGDWGEGFFSLACRTQLPAELTVTATPLEPAGGPVAAVSKDSVWHRLKVAVPAGTKRLRYEVSAKVGTHETREGPFTVALPGGNRFRFVAFGGAMQHARTPEPWGGNSRIILKTNPDFIVNTGNLMEQESWSFNFEEAYAAPAGRLLASVPQLVTPCNRDFTGMFHQLHYTPRPDGLGHTWTKVVGPVRLIGIEADADWAEGSANLAWLQKTLEADDKFVVVLCGYPAFSSGINSKYCRGAIETVRNRIMPVLAARKATLMLSSWDPDYERIEPTPDKGITQIVTGCIGTGTWHRWDTRMGTHDFKPLEGNARGTIGPHKTAQGTEWVGYFGRRHFCVFDVSQDALKMTVLAAPAQGMESEAKDLTVLDTKTFVPRNRK